MTGDSKHAKQFCDPYIKSFKSFCQFAIQFPSGAGALRAFFQHGGGGS
jgi:hypothetical protein